MNGWARLLTTLFSEAVKSKNALKEKETLGKPLNAQQISLLSQRTCVWFLPLMSSSSKPWSTLAPVSLIPYDDLLWDTHICGIHLHRCTLINKFLKENRKRLGNWPKRCPREGHSKGRDLMQINPKSGSMSSLVKAFQRDWGVYYKVHTL